MDETFEKSPINDLSYLIKKLEKEKQIIPTARGRMK